jgi:hypothetical protein
MFLVLAHTDEFIAAYEAFHAAFEASTTGNVVERGALDTVTNCRCCGTFETEADARASFGHDEGSDVEDPPKWRQVAYLFKRMGQEDGRFAVRCGDNGWEFAIDTPEIVIGMFTTREEAAEWADANGSMSGWVFELDPSYAKQVAA